MSERIPIPFHNSYAKPSAESLAALQALTTLRSRIHLGITIEEYQELLATAMGYIERYARSVRPVGRDMALEDYRLIMMYYTHAFHNWIDELEKGNIREAFDTKIWPKWKSASHWIGVTVRKFNDFKSPVASSENPDDTANP